MIRPAAPVDGEQAAFTLAPGTTVLARGDDGFVEDVVGVRRLRGPGLAPAVRAVLAPLGAVEDAPNDTAVGGTVPGQERQRWLEHFTKAGIVNPVHGQGAASFPQVVLAGDQTMTQCAAAALCAATVATRRWDAWAQEANPAGDVLVLLLARSVFDARLAQRSEACVRMGVPHVVAAVYPGRGAFVTPVWRPGGPHACLACVRTRLFANCPSGRLHAEYHTAAIAPASLAAAEHWEPASLLPVATSLAARRAAIHAYSGKHVDADRGDDLLWIPEDLSVSRRRVLRAPTCPACAHREHQPAEETLGLLAAVDDVCGIVHAASVRPAQSGPRIYLAASTTADNTLVSPNLRPTLNGGAGFTRRAAQLATVGEAVERYCAGLYRKPDLRLARHDELDEPAVDPAAFALFSPEQYASGSLPYTPFTSATPVRWVRAVRWHDAVPVWVPAGQVYLPYRRVPEEADIAPQISTGLAAGPDLQSAVQAGLQEVLERDALSISWLHRLPPRPVCPSAVRSSGAVSAAIQPRSPWQVQFHDLSLDVAAPVIAAVLHYKTEREDILAFGSACRPTVAGALEKAFLEAAQGLGYIRRLLHVYEGWECATDFSNVDEFNKHAILYTKLPHLRAEVGYLVDPLADVADHRPVRDYPLVDEPSSTQSLDAMVADVRAHGLQVYVVDLTPPDVQALGVRVVRVLVPGMHHLAGMHPRRYLGGGRLRDLPRRLASVARDDGAPIGSRPDNPYPHPLP